MNNAKMSDKKNVSLTAPQLAAFLTLEGQMAQLQIAANQLGAFLKMEKEANILIQAMTFIGNQKNALMAEWERKVQLVPAEAMPKGVINGVEP